MSEFGRGPKNRRQYDDYEPDYEEEPELEPEVQLETGYDNIIIVDNLPIVDQSKQDKLLKVITKIYSQIGTIVENGLYLPTDANNNTKGYAFIEFSRPEEANLALQQTNGYRLDKAHVFQVNNFADFDKFGKVPEEYIPPKPLDYQERENIRWWLLNKKGADQYVTRFADETEVYWLETNPNAKPEPFQKKRLWTDTYVQWSPMGHFMATFHVQGIILWGGPNFAKMTRFNHPGVKLIDFSPKENFIVTYAPQHEAENPKDPQSIIVWDIRSGKKLRNFASKPQGKESNSTANRGPSGPGAASWPIFQWSFDDKYLARLGEDMISVYETPSMDLLDKKSIKITGVKDFSWSPAQHLISFWVPEIGNSAARVVLMDIPSRIERRQQNLFNVSDCKLHWQNTGEYLCVKVDRFTKTKKSTYTNFEIFRIKEKDIPVEILEIKEPIVAFAWEPHGTRFAIIHGDSPKPDISFYELTEKKLNLLKKLEKKAATHLFWSSQGQTILIAGLRTHNGVLEFFNVNEMEIMATQEHFMCTDVEWDPSGRYVATYVSHWRHQLENGYCIWSFNGKLIQKVSRDRFYQFLWRPRPPSILSEEQEKDIRKNLHQYSKKFDEEDSKVDRIQKQAQFAKRQELRDSFKRYMAECAKDYAAMKPLRIALTGGKDSDDEKDFEYKEEWIEELLDETEEVVEL